MDVPLAPPRVAAPYAPVVLPDTELSEWRLNTLQVSPELDLMFLAVGNRVQVRRLSGPSGIPASPHATLLQDAPDAAPINQLRTGHIAGRAALMTVDDTGHVHVFWIAAIRAGTLAPALSLLNEESTWGVSMCARRPLIAVSANNWRVSVWDLERTVLRRGRLLLAGHSHNIPCIDFDPSGNLLASVSIDRTVRLWDLERGELIAQRRIDIHWGWTCRWLRASDVRQVRQPLTVNVPAAAPPAAPLHQLPVVANAAEDADVSDEEGNGSESSHSDEERLPLLLPDVPHDAFKRPRSDGGVEEEAESEADREEREAEERAKRWLNALVLCTDRDFVYLYDSKLNSLARCRFLPDAIQLGGPHRLGLSEWIPELSVLLVASQGFRARIIHVQRNHAGTYTLTPGDFLPPLTLQTPPLMLMGLSVSHLKSEHSPSLDVWIVHIIFQDGTLYCYELRHPADLDRFEAAAADV